MKFFKGLKAGVSFLLILSIIPMQMICQAGENKETEEAEETTQATVEFYDNSVPSLYDGYSDFTGPWAFELYAKDSSTSYIYHEAYDGYVPKAGDMIITGDDDDLWYFSEDSFENATGLRTFPYGEPDMIWNGHILYVADVTEDGIMTCYEGNSIAPGQDLEQDDPEYIYKSSIDVIELDFYTSETLTENKVPEKEIRAVIQTQYSPVFVETLNQYAKELLTEFNKDPSAVREMLFSYYPYGAIDWCALYIHHMLLTAFYRYWN